MYKKALIFFFFSLKTLSVSDECTEQCRKKNVKTRPIRTMFDWWIKETELFDFETSVCLLDFALKNNL